MKKKFLLLAGYVSGSNIGHTVREYYTDFPISRVSELSDKNPTVFRKIPNCSIDYMTVYSVLDNKVVVDRCNFDDTTMRACA
jgi:hypothetical protein